MITSKSKILIMATLVLLIVFYTPSSTVGAEEDAPISIITSTALIEDFVTNIGGDLINVSGILVEGNEDPHTYEPLPSEINAIINADVFFLMGREDLEPWWSVWENSILQDNPDLHVIKIMNDSMVEMDELTGENNPHGWMSPIIAKGMVRNIYLELKSILPINNIDILESQYLAYLATLDQLTAEIQGNRTLFEGTKVVVHHPSFKYLYDLLGIERIGAIEEQHDVEPSAQHIQDIKNVMTDHDCHLIVHQANLDEDQIMQIARDTDSEIIWGASLIGMEGINGEILDTYEKLIRYNIWTLQNPIPPSDSAGILSNYMMPFLIISGISILGLGLKITKKKKDLL